MADCSVLTVIALWTLTALVQSEDTCVVFPDNNPTFTFSEVKAVRVPFTVSDICLSLVDTIEVWLVNSTLNVTLVVAFCQLTNINRGNFSLVGECQRDVNTSSYVINRRPQSEFETWRVSGLETFMKIFNKSVSVFIKSLPNVTNVTIATNNVIPPQNRPVDINDNVTITCIWTTGNYAFNATLHKNGIILVTSESESTQDIPHQLHYVINKTECGDVGKYTCDVPTAKNNGSVVLYVKCTPQFLEPKPAFLIQPSGLLYLKFAVRVYSSRISHCTFWRYPDDGQTDNVLQRHLRADGCPSMDHQPGQETTLTFVMESASPEAVGVWLLNVTDEFGSTGTVRFSIVSENITVDGPTSDGNTVVFIVVGVGVTVVIVLIIVLVVSCRRQPRLKQGQHVRHKGANQQAKQTRGDLYRGSNVSMMVTNNIYDSSNVCTRKLSDPTAADVMEACSAFGQGEVDVANGYATADSNPQPAKGNGLRPLVGDYEEISDVKKDRRAYPLPLPKLHTENCDTAARCDVNQYACVNDIIERKRQSKAVKVLPNVKTH